jgi:hypothetical protein
MAAEWLGLLDRAPRGITAEDLYLGRAFVESKRVAHVLNASLYVVSAGLGLVHGAELVPNYDLTVVKGGALERSLETAGVRASRWWSLLTRRSDDLGVLGGLITQSAGLVMVALPASYICMVCEDLGRVGPRAVHKLRIFTSEAGASEVPRHLKGCVLPYDKRLEGLEGFNGTRAEFPQRALRHFVTLLGGQHLPLEEAHRRVEAALSGLEMPVIPLRQRKTDAEIASMLRMQWTSQGGRSTSLHRYLRDQALVACEQSRFRVIWQQVRSEFQAREGSACAA